MRLKKIKLFAFDPLWKEQYETEKDILKRRFGEFPVTFYHISSTSILGCSAKPILKQELATRDSTDITQYVLGKERFIKSIDYLAAKQDTGKFWQKQSSSKKNTWNQEEILAAMEANMHLQMTYFAKYLPVMSLHFEPDVTVVMSEIPDDTFNYMIGAQFETKHAEKRIREVLRLFTSKNLPFSWWVSERDTPNSLPSLLEKQGLSPKEDDIGMSLFLDSFNRERRNKELLIKRVLTQPELKNFAAVMVNIGGYSKVYEKFFEKIPSTLYGKGAPFEIYVGYLEEVPVVTGILVLHANVGGIYYVMTHPEYRKRGYATEMMISLLLRAKAKNYHLVTLQASASGKSLYQKLGFETRCTFIEFA